jgi:hypothetical protein
MVVTTSELETSGSSDNVSDAVGSRVVLSTAEPLSVGLAVSSVLWLAVSIGRSERSGGMWTILFRGLAGVELRTVDDVSDTGMYRTQSAQRYSRHRAQAVGKTKCK